MGATTHYTTILCFSLTDEEPGLIFLYIYAFLRSLFFFLLGFASPLRLWEAWWGDGAQASTSELGVCRIRQAAFLEMWGGECTGDVVFGPGAVFALRAGGKRSRDTIT